jgi:tRNA 2-thiouridine synthesizing protein A
MIVADVDVDARGLNCPLPILRARKALNDMQHGQTLKVLSTDPGSAQDFRVFAERAGHALLELSQAGGEYTIVLRKA